MNSRKIFYKFLSIFISLNLAFVSAVTFYNVPVYATSTNQNDDWFDTAQDYIRDCLFQLCADCGIIVDLAIGDADSAMENFYIHNYLLDKTYKEYIEEHFVSHDDGSASMDAELYQFLLDFIEANKDSSFNISDYVYCWYPSYQQSTSVPTYSSMKGKAWDYNLWCSNYPDVVNDWLSHKLRWWTFADSESNPYVCFLDSEYENDFVAIYATKATIDGVPCANFGYYHFNSELSSFTEIPISRYVDDGSGGKTISTIKRTSNYSTTTYGCPFIGMAVDGSKRLDTHYFGSVRFPIFLSQEKYLQYRIKFQGYENDIDYVINEDNSVTINNFYYGGGGSSTDPIDYSQYLQYILSEIQAVNSSISNLDMNCDHSVMESYLQSMNNQLTDLYSLLALVVSKMDSNASDYADIVNSLDALSAKLDTINNSINNPDYSDVTDRLDLMEGTVEEMKDLISDQNSSISDIKETITNMDGNISEINITIQNLSSSINDQFLSITKNGFKDVVDQLQDLNDNLVALSRALVGKDTFEDALSGVKSKIPDDIILASVNELAELQEEALSFGGALGDILFKIVDLSDALNEIKESLLDPSTLLYGDILAEIDEHLEKIIKQLRFNNFLTGVDTLVDAINLFYDVLNNELSDLASDVFSNKDQLNAVSGQLSKKFPFSLPYDIQAILLILVAEPVDPVFEIPFRAGSAFSSNGYLVDEVVTIDFTEFHQTIEVLHFFIKLYWMIGLLYLTPKVVRRNGGM